VVRASPAGSEAGREAVEQELDAEFEALVAIGDIDPAEAICAIYGEYWCFGEC
jgi:hypothetical protein